MNDPWKGFGALPDLPDPDPSSPATCEQPAPAAGEGPAIWEAVLRDLADSLSYSGARERLAADIRARDAFGRQKYRQPLRPANGRHQLVDAYQEAIDLLGYLACAREEWDAAEAPGRAYVASAYSQALTLALGVRYILDCRDAGEWGPGVVAKDEGGEE